MIVAQKRCKQVEAFTTTMPQKAYRSIHRLKLNILFTHSLTAKRLSKHRLAR